ncbi:phosphatase PAP2 family protein [bacterium]|nr:phosphatase PAP2 family protein [bacterium]
MTILLISIFTSNIQAANIGQSAKNAAFSKWVYIPSILALGMAFTSVDKEISSYASEKRPIFKTKERASSYGDFAAFYVSPILALSTSIYVNYMQSRPFIYNFRSLPGTFSSYALNSVIKDKSGRIRPDDSNSESFPSSHTAIASSLGEHSQNEMSLFLPSKFQIYSILFIEGLIVSTAWSRLESKRHHFSDVLAGYAIGKFFSIFFREWLFSDDEQQKLVYLDTDLNTTKLGMLWTF